MPVQVVDLELDEIPRVRFGDRLEDLRRVVEGEADLADLPLLLHPLDELVEPAALDRLPVAAVQRVQEIEVKVTGPALPQLLRENALRVLKALDGTDRQLVGEEVGFAGIAAQRFSDKEFTPPAVIRPGGVKVVEPCLQGVIHQLLRLLAVDGAVFLRQPHHAETEQRQRKIGIPKTAPGQFAFFRTGGGSPRGSGLCRQPGERSKRGQCKRTFQKIASIHDCLRFFANGFSFIYYNQSSGAAPMKTSGIFLFFTSRPETLPPPPDCGTAGCFAGEPTTPAETDTRKMQLTAPDAPGRSTSPAGCCRPVPDCNSSSP